MSSYPMLEVEPRPSIPHRRMPHSLELTVLFREFIQYWTGLRTRIPESESFHLPPDQMEFSVRWTGPVKGTLVLRSTRKFVEDLTRSFLEKDSGAPDGMALLREMMGLYAVFLAYFMWGEDFMELGPFLARPCQSSDYPNFKPYASCEVEVEGEPVKISLWIDPRTAGLPLSRGKRTGNP